MSVEPFPAASSTPPGLMARLLAALRLLPLPALPPHPHLLPALLLLAPRARTVHQVVELRALAASWLAEPQRLELEQHLQQALHRLATAPPLCPISTKSRTKMARSTGKRRR